MKSILIILPVLPWPLTSGGHQGSFNSINAIKDDYNVFVTYDAGRRDKFACWHDEFKKALNGKVSVIPYIDNPKSWTQRYRLKRYCGKIIDRITKQSPDEFFDTFASTTLHCDGYYRFINAVIANEKIDLVQVEYIENMDIVLALPDTVKKLFVHHELRYIRNMLGLSSQGDTPRRKALVDIEKIKEIGLLNKYDGIITVSSADADKLKNEGVTTSIYPSFSIVNTDSRFENVSSFNHYLSFVGPEVHLPNKEGLLWFLDNVWPLVLNNDTDYKLKIIGQWSEKSKKEWVAKYRNISFCGFVPNLRDELKGTVMIVPLTIGSGIRMKILEAMSYCIPFVSTTIGAEGIPVVDMESCRISDTPTGFCECILSLQDNRLRNNMVNSAYNIVSKQYSKEALKANKLEIFESVFSE